MDALGCVEEYLKDVGNPKEDLEFFFSRIEKLFKERQTYLEIAEEMESLFRKRGYELAFPINLSRNNEAAHYSPGFGDGRKLGEDLVKVDIGLHKQGHVIDCARSFDLSKEGKFKEIIEATKDALKNAVKEADVGKKVSDIGKTIEEIISSYNLRPVVNLGGHGLGRFSIHEKPFIPNIEKFEDLIEDNSVFAIEPFATDGLGFVREGNLVTIFGFENEKPLRNNLARKMLEKIRERKKLPFSERWIMVKGDIREKMALKELTDKGVFKSYPLLSEEREKIVSQCETTIVIKEGKKKTVFETWRY